jgi:hypothetical protein
MWSSSSFRPCQRNLIIIDNQNDLVPVIDHPLGK